MNTYNFFEDYIPIIVSNKLYNSDYFYKFKTFIKSSFENYYEQKFDVDYNFSIVINTLSTNVFALNVIDYTKSTTMTYTFKFINEQDCYTSDCFMPYKFINSKIIMASEVINNIHNTTFVDFLKNSKYNNNIFTLSDLSKTPQHSNDNFTLSDSKYDFINLPNWIENA